MHTTICLASVARRFFKEPWTEPEELLLALRCTGPQIPSLGDNLDTLVIHYHLIH